MPRFETVAVHAGSSLDPATRAVSGTIYRSTTFERAPDGSWPSGFVYARDGNPNRAQLERALAELEGGEDAVAFASGMAAINAVFQALAPGDHVVAPLDAYYGTPILLKGHFARWGLETTFVDMVDPDAVARALRPNTRLLWVESPSNPMVAMVDIAAVARIGREAGIAVTCDNTWATPYLQQPLSVGCTHVMHSTTKYLSGHSDVMGGAIVGSGQDPLFERIRDLQHHAGAVPSPMDAWLVLRGIRSLPCRMRAHCAGAQAVAEFLATHPSVIRVHYPGLVSDPGHAVAKRQMNGFGGMLSFEVEGGREAAFRVSGRLELITRATSLGGPESLIEHRASAEGKGTRAPEGLLRMSVGLEHPEDLIGDLAQALGEV
jgi:cystathionine gamma-synthase